MKTKYYILGVLTILCLLGTGYYAWALYDTYCKQVSEWNKDAKVAFEEALWLEVNKRAEIPIFHYSSEQHGITSLETRIPEFVSVMTNTGFKKYKIEKNKYESSLIKEANKRATLSTLLSMYPLSVDTLYMHWDSLLVDKSIYLTKRIRYIYTDLNLQNDTIFSKANDSSLDSLNVRYLGFRCEHELVSYVVYPVWLATLSLMDWSSLLLPWGLLMLLMFIYDSLEMFIHKKFIREKVVEKKIHVADVKIDEAKIFLLPDDSLLDSYSGTLTNGEFSKRLSPQSIILLKLFLRKDNHSLSSKEIEQELWEGKGSVDRLHKAIQRLRADLKNVSSKIVIKNVNGNYVLKSPISSNNS